MIVLAVVLLLLVAATVLFVAVTGSTETTQLVWDAVGIAWAPTALAVFLLGAAVMLVAEAAVGLLLRGGRRTGQRRQELKRLRRLEARQRTATGPVPATGAATGPVPATDAPATAGPVGPTTTGPTTGPVSTGPLPTGPGAAAGATTELPEVTGQHTAVDGAGARPRRSGRRAAR